MIAGADPEIVAWVSLHALPFEAELRNWALRLYGDPHEVDDLIQEVYFRLLRLPSIKHIGEPRAYLYQVARNIRIDKMRRQTVVRFETRHSIEDLAIHDFAPSPEQTIVARAELKWVLGLIAALPDRCRQVFELRKIHGLSQARTAQNLSLTENVVEKETARGLAMISAMVEQVGISGTPLAEKPRGKLRKKLAHVAT